MKLKPLAFALTVSLTNAAIAQSPGWADLPPPDMASTPVALQPAAPLPESKGQADKDKKKDDDSGFHLPSIDSSVALPIAAAGALLLAGKQGGSPAASNVQMDSITHTALGAEVRTPIDTSALNQQLNNATTIAARSGVMAAAIPQVQVTADLPNGCEGGQASGFGVSATGFGCAKLLHTTSTGNQWVGRVGMSTSGSGHMVTISGGYHWK